MADLTKLGDGAVRLTEAMLRGAGGRSVLLRMPRPGVAGDVSEELGLATATFDEVEVAPCVLHTPTGESQTYELLMGARAAAAAAGGNGLELVLAWLAAAEGVVIDGELLRVADVSARDVAGTVYVYRLELVRSAAATI